MSETPAGWKLLHSALPSKAIKPLATAVYGVAGLSDVNEGYLIQRLFASGLTWDWRIVKQEYLGFEDRAVKDKDYTQRYYLAAVHGELNIEGRMFHGSGASDNRRPDAAYKGAATVAFKNACKWAGMTAELFLDGRAIDHIYQGRVTKDPEMAPASVDALVQQIQDTYGDPAEQASDERSGTHGEGIATTPGAESPATTPVPADPLIAEDDDLIDLFALARTLRTPATMYQVRNEVAAQGVAAVRRRLILAHGRDCKKTPCEHVAALAGLK